ncbi:hypothetical protein G9464_10635 [Halostella sp. JP-L12]|uniref:ABC transporter substrate-binding protein n=1 Tax=Halostella TaxID=1843185 RepID=UPI000EF78D02|nr:MULTISPECIES: ABC transporter substrate-binding protein [Halostella]NHN48052.1 hypothetical protein [Halostella sp. JP-L12]
MAKRRPYEQLPDSLKEAKRRQVLKSLGAVAAAGSLAGCSSGDDDSPDLAGRGSDDYGDTIELSIDAPRLQNIPDIMRDIGNHWEQELGITFNIETTSWGTYLDMIWIQQDYENVAWTFFGGSPERFDPQFFLSVHTPDNPQNVSNWTDPEYTELYQEYTRTFDEERRNEIVGEMQTMWHEDHASTVNICWPVDLFPYDAERWNLEPTTMIGAGAASTMTLITAEPQGDETSLIIGGEEVNQRPNVTAPTANAMDWLFRSVYDTCRRLSLDGEFINWAIENFEVIDETTIDLTLREGMEFHDGEPVTAEDLQFTFEFLSSYTFGKIDTHVQPIDSVSLETDLTARVHLEDPWANFTTNTLVYTWILPVHIWGDVPNQVDEPVNWSQEVGNNPPGDWAASGPLQVRSVSPERIELEAYDDHFSDYPQYDELIYQRQGSEEAVRSELVEGNIHAKLQVPSVSMANQAADQGDHIELIEEDSLLTQCYSFNVNNSPGDDLVFRKALRACTNANQMMQVHRRGHAVESDSTYIHPEHPLELGRDDLPTMPEMYDPENARQMLEDADYAWDDNGQLRYPSD